MPANPLLCAREPDETWVTDARRVPAEVPPSPAGLYPAVKAALDFTLALGLFVVALPVLVVTALLVKLTSRGPAVYSQVRLGRGGRPYRIYKLRTMRHECEKHSGARWSTPGDSRVTPLGRFLRKTHLDELPQLWNVLRGDMSLVGPRPERPEFVPRLEIAVPHYGGRLLVRPGITGLAQVQLPPDTDLDSVRRKVRLDLHYIRQMGFWLDLKLVLCTALNVLGVPAGVSCLVLGIPGLDKAAHPGLDPDAEARSRHDALDVEPQAEAV